MVLGDINWVKNLGVKLEYINLRCFIVIILMMMFCYVNIVGSLYLGDISKMKIEDVIKAIERFPKEYELEYHEGNNYAVADEFQFEESNTKKNTVVMLEV